MAANEEMRVIAVGDDDQNIFEFRGSNSKYMAKLLKESNGRFVEMTENYRSSQHIVNYANSFVKSIKDRMKSRPIISMSSESGSVSITQHASTYMYKPLVDDLMNHRGCGNMCVLTQTNEEAVILTWRPLARRLSLIFSGTSFTRCRDVHDFRISRASQAQNEKAPATY